MNRKEEERRIREHMDSVSDEDWLDEITKIENERKGRRTGYRIPQVKSLGMDRSEKAADDRLKRLTSIQSNTQEDGQSKSQKKKSRKNRKRRKTQRFIRGLAMRFALTAGVVIVGYAAFHLISGFVGNDKSDAKSTIDSGSGDLSDEAMENETSAGESSGENESSAESGTAGDDVRLIMVGDVLTHENVNRLAKKDDGSYDYSFLFDNMKSTIQSADLAIVNQEVIIGGEELGVSGYPKFNAAYELADNLVDAGFDVVLQGSNHAGDKGEKAILNCINNWKTKYPDLPVLGIHDSEEDAENICVVEEKGIKIAILNYTEPLNHSVSKSYLVSRLKEDKVRSDIQKAKTLADFVVVCPHWGTEYKNTVDSKQEKWTQIFLEEGVDLVIGTHPHVLEPIETVTDPDTGHSMLVYYSLGNYASWISKTGSQTQKREIGSMADVTIGKLSDGTVGIKEHSIDPLICHISGDAESMTVYPYEDYSDTLAENHLLTAYGREFSMEFIDNYCEDIWGDEWSAANP